MIVDFRRCTSDEDLARWLAEPGLLRGLMLDVDRLVTNEDGIISRRFLSGEVEIKFAKEKI